MKTVFPTAVITQITKSIKNDYKLTHLDNKDFDKIFNKCINLYYYIYMKNMDLKETNYFVDITSATFHKLSPAFRIKGKRYNYRPMLNILNRAGVIIINDSYSSGKYIKSKYSKSYRINKKVIKNSELSEVEIDTKRIFSDYRDIDFWLNKYKEHNIIIKKAYQIEVNLDKAISFMNLNKGMELKPKSIKKKITTKEGKSFTKTVLDTRFLTNERILKYTNTLLKFYFKNLWFKVSDEGRLYYSLTALPSILRDFIEGCDEVDVVASQPSILATLVDCEAYRYDIENGDVYDKIGEGDRSKGKHIMFSKILFSNKQLKSGEYHDRIELLYPGLMNQINIIKENNSLWELLQSLEASIFVDILSKMDIVEYIVHDSVGVNNKNKQMVNSIIKEIYNDKFNLNIQLN